MKNNSPLDKIAFIVSFGVPLFTIHRKKWPKVIADFHLPVVVSRLGGTSHRQKKQISALRTLRLCGEYNIAILGKPGRKSSNVLVITILVDLVKT